MYICATTMWLGMCGSVIGGSCGLLELFPNEYLAFTLQRQCLLLECGGFHCIAMASYSAALECGSYTIQPLICKHLVLFGSILH